ncbi:unnamed protein product [Prunus armeniaca]
MPPSFCMARGGIILVRLWQQGSSPCLVIGLGHDWRSGRLAGSGLARVGLEAGAWRRWTKSWSKGELGHRATWACARQAGHVLQFGAVWRITWASHAERASLGARAGLETRAGLEPRVGLRALGTTR